MKVQLVKRDEYFFVRRKGFFGCDEYLAIHSLWWSFYFNPDERYYGFTSLEMAKTALNVYVNKEREDKEFLRKEKERRRLQRTFMVLVEEIEIDV